MTDTIRIHIWPSFRGEDRGDGGIRRVVEGQHAHLPAEGVELVDDPEAADVLACHATVPPAYVLRYPDKPLIAHCHGLYWREYEWENWALKANADVMELIRIADVVTAPSEWVANAIRRHTMRDVRVVPHGIDVSEWTPCPSKGYVLWNKTRRDAVCDPGPVNELAALMPDVPFLTTYGDDAPNVTVTGTLAFEDARKVIEQAGVYLCTTRETFGIGTLEALAAGVPVVGWNWGGQREVIEHGVDGWLARPGDIEGLKEGVEWALANREAISPKAIEKARAYSWERAASMYAAIYRETLARKREPRPKVSVIVTAYNLAQYLPDCLDSVLAQTLDDWECIIVDDASPDDCGVIAERYAKRDSRVRVIHNETNQYLAGARNTGITASRGRYVIPLDADDMLAPQALEVLSRTLDGNRAIHIAYGNVEFVEPDGRRWHSEWPVDFRLDWQLRGPGQLLPYCSMMRREVWKLTCGYRTRARSSEDCDVWLRASSYGFRPKMVTTADTLIYRNREGSMSRAEGWRDHRGWYPWARDISLAPAGAVAAEQLPVPSCDPPAVAIVIPVGPGHEKYVLDAVDSVDAQTMRQWECIVVNDTGGPLPDLPSWVRVVEAPAAEHTGWPQAVIDTAMKVARPRFRGVAAARNAGVAVARAPLYLPLDADDYLQPQALRIMLDAHLETGDIIYSDFWEDPEREGELRPYATPDYDAAQLTRKGALHAVTALTPVKVWRDAGGYDETLAGWEDWAFEIAVAAKGVCSRRVAAPLFTYRKHTGQRREQNVADFEASKAGIVAKWGRYWEGDILMACRTCGKRTTVQPNGSVAMAQRSGPAPEGAVLLQYTGSHTGAATFRGKAGTVYRFRAGEPPKFVLAQDMVLFENRRDFRVVPRDELAAPPAVTEAPAIVAEGPPPREEPATAPDRPDEPFDNELIDTVAKAEEVAGRIVTVEAGSEPVEEAEPVIAAKPKARARRARRPVQRKARSAAGR